MLYVESKQISKTPFQTTVRQTAKRKSVSWSHLITVIICLSIYCGIYATDRSLLFVASVWLMAMLCTVFVLAERPGEIFTAAKVASLLYITSFSIAPLWLADVGNYRASYYGSSVEDLLGDTAVMALVGYIAFLIGYFAVTRFRVGVETAGLSMSARQRRYALLCACVLGCAGLASYFVILMSVGGLGRLLGYVGGRADILAGTYGGWFWGMHLLFAAYGLFSIVAMPKHPWLCFALAILMAAAFAPLQGRDIVIAPIFCWLLFFNALRKPLRWRVVILGAIVIVLVSALLGAFRSGTVRNDAEGFLTSFAGRVGQHLADVVGQNVEQLDTAMVAVRYVEKEKGTIGPMVLSSWAEPLDRAFLGDVIPSIFSGVFIDLLLMPEHKGWATAASPSLPGELYIGLGWPGVIVGLSTFGAALGFLTRWHDRRFRNPLLFSAYPFLVYMTAKMVVDGTTHAFRPLIVFTAILICTFFISSNAARLRAEKVNV